MRARRPDLVVLLAVLAVGFNLRIAIIGIGPVLEGIRASLAMSSAVAGLLTTIPLVCMSAGSFAGAAVVERVGLRRLLAGCLVVIAAGVLVRAVMPTGSLLLLATVPIGMAIALAGVGLPALVKLRFPARAGAVTGAYVASLGLGAGLATLLAVPIADVLGGWRWALALAAVPAVVGLVPLLLSPLGDETGEGERVSRRARPGVTAMLALVYGLQSTAFTGFIAWVAASYEHAGWSDDAAGLMTALLLLLAIPVSLLLPGISDRGGRRVWVAVSAALMGGAILGIGLAPTEAAPLWLVMFCIGDGIVFPLSLTLPIDVGRDPGEVASLTGWMLGIGFAMSALGPVLAGALRDASGGFELPFAVLAGLAVSCGLAVGFLPRREAPVAAAEAA